MLNFIQRPNKHQIEYIKKFIFFICLIPLFRLIWLGMHDQLTANPIEFIEHSTGFWSLFILLVTLSLTPIRLITGILWQLQLRRMLGLYMFFYASLHVLTYLLLDYHFNWQDIINDIIKHPYVLVGALAYLLSLTLAITSHQVMMKRLGRHWKRLHQQVYFIGTLTILHFLWLVKKDIREPVIYGAILIGLLGCRAYFYLKRRGNSI